jgi:hypothetical protein
MTATRTIENWMGEGAEKTNREIGCAMVSNKAQDIPPFIVMDVLEKAQELERNG